MNIIGVHLKKPDGGDWFIAAVWAAVGGLVATLLVMPLFGGNSKHVIGMMLSAALAGLATACGASFDKAGYRGTVVCVALGVAGYGLAQAL